MAAVDPPTPTSHRPCRVSYDSLSDLDSSHSNPLFDEFDAGSHDSITPPHPLPSLGHSRRSSVTDASAAMSRLLTIDRSVSAPERADWNFNDDLRDSLRDAPLGSPRDSRLPLGSGSFKIPASSSSKPKSMVSLMAWQRRGNYSAQYANPLLADSPPAATSPIACATDQDIPDLDDNTAQLELARGRKLEFAAALREGGRSARYRPNVTELSANDELNYQRHMKTFEALSKS
eukprot:CAMPEP_0198201382 /NCGR_PEP_ID=MMETSP1445-20131203/4213_1 /TAXON_ID=36898 /ORGANISM="Pyramimonas sp., Strain CCMP2087" /LENGTH=231 /DNA_ID=CAMNT_0043871715 /DNA_START=44 /DNA_END=739 /DNA_ORIENTATION=-